MKAKKNGIMKKKRKKDCAKNFTVSLLYSGLKMKMAFFYALYPFFCFVCRLCQSNVVEIRFFRFHLKLRKTHCSEAVTENGVILNFQRIKDYTVYLRFDAWGNDELY